MSETISGNRAGLREYLVLSRIQIAAVTGLWPVWGALAVQPQIAWPWLGWLFAIGVSLHIYGFVLNDVVDLPVDLLGAELKDKPLVKGSISPNRALFLALVQIPLMVALALVAFGFDPLAFATLLLSIALGGAYDLWGKRFPIAPVLADVTLGLSQGFLCLFGAAAVQARLDSAGDLATTRIALVVAALATLQVWFDNTGAGMKDVGHDVQGGARTTPTWFGVRLVPEGGTTSMQMPAAFRVYAVAVKALVPLLLVLSLAQGWIPYRGWELTLSAVLVAVLILLLFASLARFLRAGVPFDRERLKRTFRRHQVLSYAIASVLLWFYVGTVRAGFMLFFPYIWYLTSNLLLYRQPLHPQQV